MPGQNPDPDNLQPQDESAPPESGGAGSSSAVPPVDASAPAPDATDGGPSMEEIEAALTAAAAGSATAKPGDSVHAHAAAASDALADALAGSDTGPSSSASAAALHFDLPALREASAPKAVQGIDLLGDVLLNVKIELGRAQMLIDEVLKLGEGSVVELDKLAGDPVDVLVNDRLVARGEVLVLNESFCVRINEIVADAEEEALVPEAV